jgi:hypothetical protein
LSGGRAKELIITKRFAIARAQLFNESSQKAASLSPAIIGQARLGAKIGPFPARPPKISEAEFCH